MRMQKFYRGKHNYKTQCNGSDQANYFSFPAQGLNLPRASDKLHDRHTTVNKFPCADTKCYMIKITPMKIIHYNYLAEGCKCVVSVW